MAFKHKEYYMRLHVEKTDSFGGCWSEHYELNLPRGMWGNSPAIIRRVKTLVGWAGVRADVVDYGNGKFAIAPRGIHEVVFTQISLEG